MNRLILTSSLLSLSLLSACSTAPVQNQPYFEQSNQAEALLTGGQPKQAARLYQNLADTYPAEQHQFRLMAAQALLQSGDQDTAKTYADSIEQAMLSEQQRQQLNLLYAQISLNHGNAEQALNRLNLINHDLLNNNDLKDYYRSRAFAFSLTGNLIASANERVKLSQLLSLPQEISDNHNAILETLSLLPRKDLILNQPAAPDILGGWMALANLLKQQNTDNTAFANALTDWRDEFPQHPANDNFLQNYLTKPRHAFQQPSSIAVMLPESGPYSQAAKAIREGFMAAYYHQENGGQQASLRFYDSLQGNPVTLYDQAVANGAELIIGPLSKDAISTLATISDLPVPVLALNHVENLSKANLFQFGLSPIDDTRQIAAKAWQDGLQTALILTPENNQGQRIANYLAEAWQDSDGIILDAQSYPAQQFDYSVPIKALLNLSESEQRFHRLRNFLGRSMEFTPRRRHDVDAIFLTAYPTAARSIIPQLRFYHATDVPVYATPHVYNGIADPRRNQDLNNITFCDIPWLFGDIYKGELSQENLRTKWQQFPDVYLRLLALGIDAYNLIAHLDKLDTVQYQGATGNLLLNHENRITRQLVCAKFKDGLAEIITEIEPASEDYQSITTDVPANDNEKTNFSTVY
jgi:uncharacterized protein